MKLGLIFRARDEGGSVTCFSADLVGRLFDLRRPEMLAAGFLRLALLARGLFLRGGLVTLGE